MRVGTVRVQQLLSENRAGAGRQLPTIEKLDYNLVDNLDTLQAPPPDLLSPSVVPKRSVPFYFTTTPPPPAAAAAAALKDRKEDRKSPFDLSGIFDTRKFFFIPSSRRADGPEVVEEEEEEGFLAKMMGLLTRRRDKRKINFIAKGVRSDPYCPRCNPAYLTPGEASILVNKNNTKYC